MATAKNKVIAGDYKGKDIIFNRKSIRIRKLFTELELNSTTVEAYELMKESHRKDTTSAATKALVGSFLLGPAGLFAGIAGASEVGVYRVAIKFKDGCSSLIEINEAAYNVLVNSCFSVAFKEPEQPAIQQTVVSASQPVPTYSPNSFCTNCGSPLAPGVRFCGSCGTPVGNVSAPVEVQSTAYYDVTLVDIGNEKIKVIKVIREALDTDCGLAKAKEIAENCPQILKQNATEADAYRIKSAFENVGAAISLTPKS